MSNTYGRQVVVPLTNKSGGVIAGDVVIIDTTNTDAFTTTTSAGFTGTVGIAQETIASNAVGRVLLSGYAALVLTSASVTRGNFGKTHTVAKQAVDAGATRGVGTFCQFLTGGTTSDAIVYPVDLLGSSLTNPMTTKGDIIQGDTGGTPLRLGAGTSGYALTAAGAGNLSAWAAIPTQYPTFGYAAVATDETTTSATYVDLATPGPTVTITVNTQVIVTLGCDSYFSSSGGVVVMGVSVAGGAPDDTNSLHMYTDTNANQNGRALYLSGLTPGSTAFKAQYYKAAGATAHFRYRTILVERMD